jgi:hypothetical protein
VGTGSTERSTPECERVSLVPQPVRKAAHPIVWKSLDSGRLSGERSDTGLYQRNSATLSMWSMGPWL